jgi:hypothetical protein
MQLPPLAPVIAQLGIKGAGELARDISPRRGIRKEAEELRHTASSEASRPVREQDPHRYEDLAPAAHAAAVEVQSLQMLSIGRVREQKRSDSCMIWAQNPTLTLQVAEPELGESLQEQYGGDDDSLMQARRYNFRQQASEQVLACCRPSCVGHVARLPVPSRTQGFWLMLGASAI